VRKVLMENGHGLALLVGRIGANGAKGQKSVPDLAVHAEALALALKHVGKATQAAWATGVPSDALANAVPYMQACWPHGAGLDLAGCRAGGAGLA
jgi:hypothetical protein